MRVGFIADIHIDFFKREQDITSKFIEVFRKYAFDILVIAGDISNNYLKTIAFVKDLNDKLPYKVYYVPGNHDMWSKKVQASTREIYDAFRKDEHCLVDKSVYLSNNTYLIGDIFWYDYSYADQSFDIEDLVKKAHGKRVWRDSIYIDWEISDGEVSQNMIDKMQNRINKKPNARYILVSHMINHKRFTVNGDRREEWKFFNGFLGSKSIYDLVKENNIDTAVCGHVHFRRVIEEEDKKFMCCCLSYPKEWNYFDKTSDELSYHVDLSLEVIEV